MLLSFMDVGEKHDQGEKSLVYKRLHISFAWMGLCGHKKMCSFP